MGPWLLAALALAGLAACAGSSGGRERFPAAIFGAPDADPAGRAAALVARMTLAEKIAQLETAAPAIPRLGIPAYDWWSESLHGVARNGTATVFPQVIGLAATFDEALVRRVAEAIADEARAKAALAEIAVRGGGQYQGLTMFAPNVNILRDPRWGRGQETFGEDPVLTARLAGAYVRGLQGDDPRRLRVAAVAKHFAVHSGPEIDRHGFDARVDAHDLADTYLPQFESLVREAHVSGIMAAYNRVNGAPCVASRVLLGETLRGRWGFPGFVVGDCGAVDDVVRGHHLAPDDAHAAALALRAGTDLDCGSSYRHLAESVRARLVSEAEIDRALVRLMTVRFRLGLFDRAAAASSSASSASARAAADVLDSPAHQALAREAARESLVLLANDGALPIAPGVRRIAVVGPVADDVDVLLGNYHGTPRAPVTLLAGIRAAARVRGIRVDHARGVTLAGHSHASLAEAVAVARGADLVIATLGLSPRLEGEAGEPESSNPAGDRRDLALPGAQPALLGALLELGKPIVVVLTGGGALALPTSRRHPDAVVMAWYPGEEGGNAVADVLFGAAAPSGRLPVTFYRSIAELPPFADYRMAGRTYRYFEGTPLYPFGAGQGYAPIAYADVVVDPRGRVVHAVVENRGTRAADEVVQVYAAARPRLAGDPLRALVAFRRVSLAAGQRQALEIPLPASAFTRIDATGARRPVPGAWTVTVGTASAPVDVTADDVPPETLPPAPAHP